MPLARCPHCEKSLTPKESQGENCPLCGSILAFLTSSDNKIVSQPPTVDVPYPNPNRGTSALSASRSRRLIATILFAVFFGTLFWPFGAVNAFLLMYRKGDTVCARFLCEEPVEERASYGEFGLFNEKSIGYCKEHFDTKPKTISTADYKVNGIITIGCVLFVLAYIVQSHGVLKPEPGDGDSKTLFKWFLGCSAVAIFGLNFLLFFIVQWFTVGA